MPEISPIILTIWGILVFVVWYFYRHHERKNRAKFLKTASIITALFFFILLFRWIKNPAPDAPTRVGIFPLTDNSITWEALAFSEVPTRYLCKFNDQETLTYQAEWITESVNLDSLRFAQYIHNFASRIKLDFAVYGNCGRKPPGYAVVLNVLDVAADRIVNRDTLIISMEQIDQLSARIHEAFALHVPGFRNPKNDSELHIAQHLGPYFKARLQLLHGNEAAAVRMLEDTAADDSSSVPVLTLLAELYLEHASELSSRQQALKVYRKARDILRKAISIEPEEGRVHRLLGEVYIENERWNDAERHLRRALNADPWPAETYVALTRLHPDRYRDLGFSHEAELLNRTIFVNPADVRARLLLADVHRTRNYSRKAYEPIREILYINPENVDGLMELGQLYMFENKLLKVLETFEKVVKLEPDNANAYYNLGIVHYHQKEVELAIRFFQRAIEISNHANSHLYLANIYEEQGDTTQAVAHLRERIRQRKGADDPFYLQARARLFELMSRSGAVDSLMSHSKSDQAR